MGRKAGDGGGRKGREQESGSSPTITARCHIYVLTRVMPTQPQDSVSITATAANERQSGDDEGIRRQSMKS